MSWSKLEYLVRSGFVNRSRRKQKALGLGLAEVDENIIEFASHMAKKSDFRTSIFLLKKIPKKYQHSDT